MNMNSTVYNREQVLGASFNVTISRLLSIAKKDYYSLLTFEQKIELKVLLSNINNIITLKLTVILAEWICNKYSLDNVVRTDIIRYINSQKPNSNGYDIELSNPNIVAEIKCLNPINSGERFGSAQKSALKNDIEGLINGKSSKDISGSVKILGLYSSQKARNATEHFIKHLGQDYRKKLILNPSTTDSLDSEHVYIVYITM